VKVVAFFMPSHGVDGCQRPSCFCEVGAEHGDALRHADGLDVGHRWNLLHAPLRPEAPMVLDLKPRMRRSPADIMRKMEKAGLWDVRPCGSCENRRFGGTCRLQQGETKQAGTTLAVSRNRCTLRKNTGSKNGIQVWEPHGVTSQKTIFFIVTAVKTGWTL
jgi:hypothetical protein